MTCRRLTAADVEVQEILADDADYTEIITPDDDSDTAGGDTGGKGEGAEDTDAGAGDGEEDDSDNEGECDVTLNHKLISS